MFHSNDCNVKLLLFYEGSFQTKLLLGCVRDFKFQNTRTRFNYYELKIAEQVLITKL